MINKDLPQPGETLKEKLERRQQAEDIANETRKEDKFKKKLSSDIGKIEESIKKISDSNSAQPEKDKDAKEKFDKKKQEEKNKKEFDDYKKNTTKKLEKITKELINVNSAKASDSSAKLSKISEQKQILTHKKDALKKKANMANVMAGDVALSDLIKRKLKSTVLKTAGRDTIKNSVNRNKAIKKITSTIGDKGLVKGISTLIRDKNLDKKYASKEKEINKKILSEKIVENKYLRNVKNLEETQNLLKEDEKEISINQQKMSDAIDKLNEKVTSFVKLSDYITNNVPKQDTTISRANYEDKDHKWYDKKQTKPVKKQQSNDGNSDGGFDVDIDTDNDRDKRRKDTKKRRLNKLRNNKIKGSLTKLATGGGLAGGLAMGASAMYIGDSLMDNYDQYQMSDNEAGRNDAVAKSVGGAAGAVTGGIIGAKALGTSGFIGGSVIPGVGNLAGLVGGAVTGGAAGAALGYYMGEGVGDYIENMWTGPLEKIPDSKRNNPFTIHEYLTGALIPELTKSLEMEQDPKKRKEIETGIGEYTDLSKKILEPDSLKKWLQSKLDDNKLATADVGTKVSYMNDLMSQFKYNENYYNAGEAVVKDVANDTGTIDKYTSKLDEFIYGKKSKEESDKKNLEKANDISNFNKSNKLGKDGQSIELSMNSSKNFDALVGSGIVSDDWGNNSIKDISKLNQLPLSVLQDLKDNGSLDDDSIKLVDKVISDKNKQPKKEENKIEKGIPSITPITTVTAFKDKVDEKKSNEKKTPSLSGIAGVNDTNQGMLNNTKSNIENTQNEDVEKLAEDSYNAEQDLIEFLNNNPYDDTNSSMSDVTIDGITQQVRLFKDGTLNKKLADLREKVLDSRRNYNDAKMVILSNSKDKDFLAQHGIYGSKKDASGAVTGDVGPRISDDEFYYKQMAKDLENVNRRNGGSRSLSGSGSGASGSSGFNGGSGSSFETGALGQSSVEDKSVPTSYEGLGGMSAQFESGGRGSSAVGWDSTGGTSYGKYQIATKTGTMRRFMDFLKGTNPAAYQALASAGPADSGKDGQFAQVWRKIAKDGTLGNSEYDFIKSTHYDVGVSGIKNKNLKAMLGSSKALQEVMWSTSVQHGGGGASSIFNDSYQDGISEQDLIKAIYAKRSTKFGSSTAEVRASVINRFGREQKLALGIQNTPSGNGDASGGVMANNTTSTAGGISKESTLTNNSVTPKIPIGEDAMVSKSGTKDVPISVDNDTKTMVNQLKTQQQPVSGGNNVAVINNGGTSNGSNTVSNASFGQKTPDPTLMYAALNK